MMMHKFKNQNSTILFSNAVHAYADDDVELCNGISEDCSELQWHAHTGIQILIVIDGTGYYQEKGKSIQVFRNGDVVFILPNVEHWHTAGLHSGFTDVIMPGSDRNEIVTWLQVI